MGPAVHAYREHLTELLRREAIYSESLIVKFDYQRLASAQVFPLTLYSEIAPSNQQSVLCAQRMAPLWSRSLVVSCSRTHCRGCTDLQSLVTRRDRGNSVTQHAGSVKKF